MTEGNTPTAADILRAAKRLAGLVRRTPLEHSLALSARAGVPVYLKLENAQRTGSFKVRGAMNAITALPEARRARGIVTASAGNHGLGVALAARLLATPVTVFVPAMAPAIKRHRIARSGAELREVDGGYDDAHRAAERWATESGALYMHAFSDPWVVAGQGTVGLEILQELPDTGTLVVPVGGGGLIGGMGLIARALAPHADVIGVQSVATAAMHASLQHGRLRSPPAAPTLCDGLAGDIDEASLALAQRVVDRVELVPEDAVRRAIRALFVEEGIVAEGSGAVAVAAIREGVLRTSKGPVVAVVSGGNIDADVLAGILADSGMNGE